MPKQTIETGIAANDGTGDSLRSGATKVNSNFTELYNSLGDGSSIKISTTGADAGEVLAFNGNVFVPTPVGGINSYSVFNADSGSATASTQGDSLSVIGGNGITTQILNGTLVINAIGGGGSGGASVTVSENPPSSPTDGDLWYDSSLGALAVWYSSQGYWVQTNASASFGDITVQGGTGSSSTTFLQLTDTPSSFIADYYVKVNASGNGLEFVENAGNSQSAASAFNPIEIAVDYTAEIYDWLFVDTSSGPVSITLPAVASLGEEVRFLDVSGTFETNNLTVISNLNIQGDSQNFIVDLNYAGFSLVYVNDTVGWLLKDR